MRVALAVVALALALAPALAQKAPRGPVQLLPGSGSREPINIVASKLDYFDKDQKLVYTGDVVAVQGESTLKSSVLTIFLSKDAPPAGAAPAAPGAPAGGASSVRRMEAAGPVTLVSKDQIGTGDSGIYDKAENKVYLNGNVTLSQGTNVTRGEKLVYDLTSGQAQVFGGRVQSIFTPGSGAPDAAKPKPGAAPASPKGKRTTASAAKDH